MNKTITFLSLFITLLFGCTCEPGCDSYTVEGYRIEKNQRTRLTTERMQLNYGFLSTKSKAKKKPFCTSYYKSKCFKFSDQILPDSTIISCNKTLKSKLDSFPSNTNLLKYPQLDQFFRAPDGISSRLRGIYDLNLGNLNFTQSDLSTPYIFTIQTTTNIRNYSDTIAITLKQ